MVKHIQTIRLVLLTNCLSVFDYFVGLALKGLTLSFMILKNDQTYYKNIAVTPHLNF